MRRDVLKVYVVDLERFRLDEHHHIEFDQNYKLLVSIPRHLL
jgi:hypothetical protein